MALNPFICVFLMSCFSSKAPLTQFPSCPDYCDCYLAPQDGYGENTAITLVCDWKERSNFISDKYKLLADKQKINSFVIENINDMERLPEYMLTGLSVNNLVLRKCTLFNVANNHQTFSGLDKDSLKVLTFIDTKFTGIRTTGVIPFDGKFTWKTFKDIAPVEAIHFVGGELLTIEDMFHVIPVEKVFSLTIDKTGLKTIDEMAFKNFNRLKMLKIVWNEIETLDWMDAIKGPLWNLDLRNNHIKQFPLKLAQKFKSLKTLMLGGNNIHIISSQTADILIGQLREFSLAQFHVDEKRKEYFYSTPDMKWVKQIIENPNPKSTKIPRFLRYDLTDYNCIAFDSAPVACRNLVEFTYPESAISSQHLSRYNDNITDELAYQNNVFMFSGVVLPFEWKENQLEQWLDKLADLKAPKGNVIKIHLNMHPWFIIPKKNMESFQSMIKNLESDLKMAESKGIFVIINLWKSSSLPPEFLKKSILIDYFENHLKPLAESLNKFKSLAAWNLFDEPINLVETNIDDRADNCLDTNNLLPSSPGIDKFFIKEIQYFLAKQAQIIHNIEPRKLVTMTMSENNALNKNTIGNNNFENRCMSRALDGMCPEEDCALDFYTVLFKTNGRNVGDVGPAIISTNSPKPVVIIVNDNHANLVEIVNTYEEPRSWEIQGILGSLTITDATLNNQIIKTISEFSHNKSGHVLGTNFVDKDI